MRDAKLGGIFTERDDASRGILTGNSVDIHSSQVMTLTVYYVEPEQT